MKIEQPSTMESVDLRTQIAGVNFSRLETADELSRLRLSLVGAG